jgi:Rieske Fe-S protein
MSIEKSRRAFLADCSKLIGSAAIASIVIPILQGCEPTSIPTISDPADPDGRFGVSVADLSESKPAKQAPGLTDSDGKGILVTRLSDTEYLALSMECTHQQCNVEATSTSGGLPCFCHGSIFNLDGTVRQGPAEEPLKRYDAIFDAAKQELRIKLS